jgi:hypothetical protein
MVVRAARQKVSPVRELALIFQNRGNGFEKAQAVRSFFAANANNPPSAKRSNSFFMAGSIGQPSARGVGMGLTRANALESMSLGVTARHTVCEPL